MWIKREIEDHWQALSREYPVLVVTGSRQVGKTSLLEHIYGPDRVVSLDLPRTAASAESSPELFLEQLELPSIIDEVRRWLSRDARPEKSPGTILLQSRQHLHRT